MPILDFSEWDGDEPLVERDSTGRPVDACMLCCVPGEPIGHGVYRCPECGTHFDADEDAAGPLRPVKTRLRRSDA